MARRAPSLVLLALFAAAACGPPRGDEVITVTETVLRLGARAAPPAADDGDWRPRTLPDVWGIARRREATEGWYRATVPLPRTPDELWAVYLPRAGLNVAAYVNGRLVGDGGRFTEPVSRNWNRPLLFTVPVGMLATGENLVHLRLKTTVRSPVVLGPFHVGPARLLRPVHERRRLGQVMLPRLVTVLAVAIGLVLGVVFLGRDDTGAYRWIIAAILLWAWAATNQHVRDVPLPAALFEWSQAIVWYWLVVCFVFGFHRLLDRRRPSLEAMLVVLGVVVSASLALVEPLYAYVAMVAWMPVTLALAAYVVALVVVAARDGRFPRARLLLVPAVLGVAFGVHDVAGLATGHFAAGILLSTWVAPLALLAAYARVLGRLLDGLRDAERLNRELEQRVREKHRVLEENYVRLHALERERAVAAERERIMRDVHDGMGSQLVSTLALVEGGAAPSDAVAEALRDALDDLRLVIDSLDPVEEDLLAVLAVVRARLEPRLERRGIRFDWRVVDLPPVPGLGPTRVLHALRIVQEAITNVVKHAGARTITVRTGRATRPDGTAGVFVEVCDDGGGMRDAPRGGRGLANMRRRAAELGGEVRVASGAGGTVVRLWLPLAPVSPRS